MSLPGESAGRNDFTRSRDDHVAAAGVRNALRAAGVQVGTIDALIAQVSIAGAHTLLTTVKDFQSASRHIDLRLWTAPAGGRGETQ